MWRDLCESGRSESLWTEERVLCGAEGDGAEVEEGSDSEIGSEEESGEISKRKGNMSLYEVICPETRAGSAMLRFAGCIRAPMPDHEAMLEMVVRICFIPKVHGIYIYIYIYICIYI